MAECSHGGCTGGESRVQALEEENAALKAANKQLLSDLRELKGTHRYLEQLGHHSANSPSSASSSTSSSNITCQSQGRSPPADLLDSLCYPEGHPDGEPGPLRTISLDTAKKGASEHGLACGVHAFVHDESKGPPELAETWTRKVMWISEKMAKFLDAKDQESGRKAMDQSVNANVALRNNTTALIKTFLQARKMPYMIRTIVYHPNEPADIAMMWFIPVVVKHEGRVYEHGFINFVSREQTALRMYEAIMHDHLGLKFTPAIVSVVDTQGDVIHQNAASMAAFGLQGSLHRAEGTDKGFNLLQELFAEEPGSLQDMYAVTGANNMFSCVLKIKSPLLRRWLEVPAGCDLWHQVQISRARDAITLEMVYVVAQVDVTAAVLTEHKVVQLQAENTDLHWTTAWLEDQKQKADAVNQRLKESLVEALAVRDERVARGSALIDTDSPADKAIKLLNKILEGQEVTMREVLAVRDVLQDAGPELLQPVNFRQQMGMQMNSGLDEEVGRSLIDLLVTKRGVSFSGDVDEDDGDVARRAPSTDTIGVSVGPGTDDDNSLPSPSSGLWGGAGSTGMWGSGVAGPYQPLDHRLSNGARGSPWSRVSSMSAGGPPGSATATSASAAAVAGTSTPLYVAPGTSPRAIRFGSAGGQPPDASPPLASATARVDALDGMARLSLDLPPAMHPAGSGVECKDGSSLTSSTGLNHTAALHSAGGGGGPASGQQSWSVRAGSLDRSTWQAGPIQRPGSSVLDGRGLQMAQARPTRPGQPGLLSYELPPTTPSTQGSQHASACSTSASSVCGEALDGPPATAGAGSSSSASPILSAVPGVTVTTVATLARGGSTGAASAGGPGSPVGAGSGGGGAPLGGVSHSHALSSRDRSAQHARTMDRAQLVALMEIGRTPPDHLARILAAADEWGWDPFQLSDATGGRPLSAVTYSLLKRHHADVLKACHVDEVRLCRFLVKLEEGYMDNPYHNRIHASDVVQWTHVLMLRGGVLPVLQVGDAGTLAVYLAAAVHDVGHKGLNNDFLVRSGDSLALLYNDLSPMENHHLAYTFQLLAQESYNFLARAPQKVKDTLRKQVITMVLATDMKQHFTQTSLFKAKLSVDESSSSATNSGEVSSVCTVPGQLLADDEIKSLSLSVGLKCADLGHLCSPTSVHLRWVRLLEEELFLQGDLEKAKGLAVSALMDRCKAGITKSQAGFFGVVAMPLFQHFAKVFTHATPLLDGLTANYQHWLDMEQQGK